MKNIFSASCRKRSFSEGIYIEGGFGAALRWLAQLRCREHFRQKPERLQQPEERLKIGFLRR